MAGPPTFGAILNMHSMDTKHKHGGRNEEKDIQGMVDGVCHQKSPMTQGGLQIWVWGTTAPAPNALL